MNLQKYTPNYTLDVILFDNSFYILENTNINHIKLILTNDKFIELNGHLVATSAIKKVEKRLLKPIINKTKYYKDMASQTNNVSKEAIERAKEHARNLKT